MPLILALDCADERWLKSWPPHFTTITDICRHVLSSNGLACNRRDIEISVVLTGDAEIQRLNKTHRGKDKPTNVLSFPAYDAEDVRRLKAEGPPVLLGDIVLAYDIVLVESRDKGVSFPDHGAHLIIHGLLHLLGFDHVEDDDADIMEAKEIDFCRVFGIADPYS